MNSAAKNILYLVRRSPYDGVKAQEFLDAVLVGAVFEQAVSILFIDDGVWQLHASQNVGQSGLKSIAQQLSVMPEYDIESVYVCSASLQARALTTNSLCLPVASLNYAAQATLISTAEVVISD